MSSPPPNLRHWYLHKSRRDDLIKIGISQSPQAPEGRPTGDSSQNFGRRFAALPWHVSPSGGFAPGFIRSPLRGCASQTACVDATDAGSVEAMSLQTVSVRWIPFQRVSGSQFADAGFDLRGGELQQFHAGSIELRECAMFALNDDHFDSATVIESGLHQSLT